MIALLGLIGAWFGPRPAAAQDQAVSSSPPKRAAVVRSFPLTKFYDAPDPLPAGSPGDLIRSAEFDGYNLPLGVSAVRFLYRSRSAGGQDVASSGVILFPDKKPPAGGWPVIAWAHGLDGVARQCAPSLARHLPHGPFLAMYVNVGYAVVATDYTGLGTSFRSAFADTLSNASDVIYSVPAARRAVSGLGSRWVAMGTDEGGMAVVGVAELEHDLRDSNFLGSIAISRLADLQEMYGPASSFSYNLPLFLAYGVKTVYPHFEISEILTDKALPLYQQVGQACNEGGTEPAPATTLLKSGWESNQFVRKYFDRNRIGLKPADAPLLVVSSADELSIRKTTKIVERLCQQGDRVQFEKYPEDDPGRIIGDSVRDQMAWIQARFAGRQAPSNCPGRY